MTYRKLLLMLALPAPVITPSGPLRAGTITIAGVAVRYADIFLGSVSAAGIPDFGYAIALGYQAENGGLAAGFYTATNDEASQAIWGSRAGFV